MVIGELWMWMWLMMLMMITAHNRHNTLICNWCGCWHRRSTSYDATTTTNSSTSSSTKVHAVGCNSTCSMRLEYTIKSYEAKNWLCVCRISDTTPNSIFTGLSLHSAVALGIFQKLMTLQGIQVIGGTFWSHDDSQSRMRLLRDVPVRRRWSWCYDGIHGPQYELVPLRNNMLRL